MSRQSSSLVCQCVDLQFGLGPKSWNFTMTFMTIIGPVWSFKCECVIHQGCLVGASTNFEGFFVWPKGLLFCNLSMAMKIAPEGRCCERVSAGMQRDQWVVPFSFFSEK